MGSTGMKCECPFHANITRFVSRQTGLQLQSCVTRQFRKKIWQWQEKVKTMRATEPIVITLKLYIPDHLIATT